MSFRVLPAGLSAGFPRLSRLLPLGLAIAAALPGTALAANADAGDELDEVVVTATRTAVTTDAALAPVEVIDRDEILRAQATSLADLLRGRAGINLSNQGGDGKLTTMFVRGSESDHVLVLIDGVRVGSATSGLVSFQDLPVALIDRIEIVRGPRSSLYGSEAIGGVIQIFTRRDRGEATFRFNAGAGSHGRREGGIGIGGGSERGWFGLDAGFKQTNGINACRGAGFPIFAGCFVDDQPDRDGYRQHAFSLRGGVNLGESVTLQGHALRVSGENEYDGSFVDNSDIVQQVVGAQLKWQAGERVAVQLAAGSNKDESENFLGSTPSGAFATRRDSASVQSDITLAERQVLTVGLDWLRDRVDSDTVYDDTRRGNRALFAQYQGGFGAQDVQLALRRDDNDQFGGKTTGSVAWGLGFAEHWRITASYGTAFKAPTFNELYFPFFGNPALRPESSKTVDLGLAWRGERSRIAFNAFETRVDDLIAYDGSIFLPNNIEKTRLRGAELQLETVVFGWSVNGAASWLDPENRVRGANEGNDLPRRARETARIDVDRAFGDFSLGLTGVAEGKRYDNLANTRRIDGFATLDLRAEYRFARHWTVQARVANLFDERYETTSFYNQPGRTWSLMLRFQPAD
ncbi:TonB-dependent vitamin B12 receptor [Lysobacter brunescens]|uniref:TonB-dependent vitamin B12 receptor n=1 Tax=Lysobacter brunescens TaxID=262323 RepID=A0ABW2Y871_9GAMM